MLTKLQVQTVEYPESDGQPVGETGFHVTQLTHLLSMLREFFRDRDDVYVGANMFVYYQEGDPTRNVAPDVFVAFGVTNAERRIWKVWEEGTGPDVVFELTSRGTWSEDLGTKKGLYEWLGVREYFIFDLLGEYLSPALRGFRLTPDGYREIEAAISADGLQLTSEVLGLLLAVRAGQLRLIDRATGRRLLSPPELADARDAAEARAETLEAEVDRLRAELMRLRGDQGA